MSSRVALALVASTCLVAACSTREARPIEPACGEAVSPLARYLTCEPGDGLRIAPASSGCSSCRTYRIFEVGGLPRMVSVAEGYDLAVLEDGRSAPFAHLRIERSEPGRYPSDTDIVRSAIAARNAAPVRPPVLAGVESHFGPAGVVLFFERDQAIVTVGFPESAAPRRISVAQRRFLERYVECVKPGEEP